MVRGFTREGNGKECNHDTNVLGYNIINVGGSKYGGGLPLHVNKITLMKQVDWDVNDIKNTILYFYNLL